MFKLGTFDAGGRVFAGMILDDSVVDLAAAAAAFADSGPGRTLGNAATIQDLLDDWDRNFANLQEFAAFIERETLQSDRIAGAVSPLSALHALTPVPRPSKMLYAAANYRDHVEGMNRTFRKEGVAAVDPAKDYKPEKEHSEPYLFVKASSCLSAPDDEIVLPPGMQRIDWEAELAVVIGRRGKNIPAAKTMDHVAGFMTTNDVSCRDRTFRPDRPGIRSDWLSGKSWDGFAPTGPFLVPRAFVPDHTNLRIWCWINGETKQDGNSGDMVFNTEDQIEYASKMLTLLPGDIFATGTPGGTGQERLEFLKAGDVVETEVEHCGRMRNHVVAGSTEYVDGR